MHHHLQTSGGVSSVDLLAACLEQCVEIEYSGMVLMFLNGSERKQGWLNPVCAQNLQKIIALQP